MSAPSAHGSHPTPTFGILSGDMTPGREPSDRESWAKLKSLFNEALDRPREEWPAFVLALRGRDPSRADQLQRLLDGHVEAFLEVGPPGSEELQPGTEVGPYVITGLIGEGGMGRVYRARDARLGRHVAIKVLPPSLAHEPARRVRMEREARATGMLNHPNIVTVYDVGHHRGAPFIVTELLEGQTLRQHVAGKDGVGGRLDPKSAVDILTAIADAAGAAHDRAIVHRDIKPENVFLTSDGRIKVLDFGIAKLADAEAASNATATGVIVGTLGYMAPEQLRGDPPQAGTDVYACGVVLYELLMGARPFVGGSQAALIGAILHRPAPPLESAPPALALLVARCLAKEPEARYRSGAALAGELRALRGALADADNLRDLTTVPLDAAPDLATAESRGMHPRRTSFVAVGIALLASVVIGALWLQHREVAPPSTPAAIVDKPGPSAPASPPPTAPQAGRPDGSTPPIAEPRRSGPAPTSKEKPTVPTPTPQSPQTTTAPATPQPQSPAAAPSLPLSGVWTLSEQVTEDVQAIECAASGALQITVGDGVLDGSLRLKQDCKDTKRKTTESTEEFAALTAGTIVGDAISFSTRTTVDDVATTCRYSGRVVGSSKATMAGEVTCEARAAGLSSVLTLRGSWRANRMPP